jgi:hypothetical protein
MTIGIGMAFVIGMGVLIATVLVIILLSHRSGHPPES